MFDPLAEVVTLLQPGASFSKIVSGAGAWRVRRSVSGQPFYCAILDGGTRLSVAGQPAITLHAGDFVLIPAAYDFEEQVRDMRAYLRRLGGVRSPEELKSMRGFNGCSGMLMVLRTVFEKTRWELLHEAALLLTNCINLIGGQP